MQIFLFWFCDWYLNFTFFIKNNFAKYVYFQTFLNFKFSTFSKKQQFGELFQKRFATGICDLRGGGTGHV